MKGLYKKILSVQDDLDAVKKSKENPHFKSSYFDINLLIKQIKPLFVKHGVAVTQPLVNVDGEPAIQTNVVDVDTGESLSYTFPLPSGLDAQKMGGAITFYRRYSITSMFFVEGENDDDGNESSGGKFEKKKVTPNDFPL